MSTDDILTFLYAILIFNGAILLVVALDYYVIAPFRRWTYKRAMTRRSVRRTPWGRTRL